MKNYDYLIVGSGFSGAVLAERLNSIKKKVLIIEKRNHIGGNSYDFYNENDVLVHKYGPHYFRTDSIKIFNYLSKFTLWRPFKYRIRSFVNGELYPFPINRNTINQVFKVHLKNEKETKKFLDRKKAKIKNPKNAEEQVLSKVGQELYELFFKNYTIKQWNRDPKNLDASVTARIPIRYNNDDRYFKAKIQVMPKDGYSKLFEHMLDSIGIWLNTDFFKVKDDLSYSNLIFTGPIDEFFKCKFGKLQYRSLRFIYENHDQEFYQDWVQINYPNDYNFTRIVEIKHATGQKTKKLP